jgi:CRP-like cAMP-binding protein/di/tricarboxylate transporter
MNAFEETLAAAEALARVPFFAMLTAVDLAKLAGVLEDRWNDAGTVVFEAGGTGDALYVLREGVAERRVAGSAIGVIAPLAVFGELALLTDEPRSASIVAVTPIRLWVLPRQRFESLLRAEPDLMLHLSAAIGGELARARRALGELQRELDVWIGERLEALAPGERAVIEAAALFRCPPPRVLARLSGPGTQPGDLRMLDALTPLLHPCEGSHAVPPAIRRALMRRLDAEHRTSEVAARVRALAETLEAEGEPADAAAAYLAANARADAERTLARMPAHARAAVHSAASALSHDDPAPAAASEAARNEAVPQRRLDVKRVASIAVALAPFLLWTSAPPEGLSLAGWHVLLSIVSAAILFATEALPEAVVALALLAVWVVTGVVEPRVALGGFATQAWILVLAVLAVGVAVGNTGLLYRVALVALGVKPAGFAKRCLTLALVGTAVTPTLPNATSRMALAAPMVREVAEALGYEPRGKAAAGLALAALIGFGQMAGLFLTGSSVGLLVHGLLPPDMRADFNFAGWFLTALPLHLALFSGALVAVVVLYRPHANTASAGDRLALQRAVLGPMRNDEKLCLAVLAGLIAGFLTEPLHGINGAWLGVAALVALAAGRALDTTMLRTGVNWPFLVFFGVITSLATVFDTLDIGAWLADVLAAPIRAVAGSSLSFCLALAVAGFVLSFVVRWQAAAPLLTLVALPAAGASGVHPFLVALISLVSTQVWFLPYQSTVYLALYHGSGELFSHAQVRRLAWLWGALVLGAIALALPVWQAMGLA